MIKLLRFCHRICILKEEKKKKPRWAISKMQGSDPKSLKAVQDSTEFKMLF